MTGEGRCRQTGGADAFSEKKSSGGRNMPITEGMLYSGIVIGAAVPVCVAAAAGSNYTKELLRRRRSVRLRKGAAMRKNAQDTCRSAEKSVSQIPEDERNNQK